MTERTERAGFINSLIDVLGGRYLEIGLGTGVHFKLIDTPQKVGVDVEWVPEATHVMPSDKYFANHCSGPFDVIFIDGDHRCEQVVRDFNNARRYLSDTGVILVHDLVPPDVTYTTPAGCGDGFKMLSYFVERDTSGIMVLRDTLGLTLFLNLEEAYELDYTYQQFKDRVFPKLDYATYQEAITFSYFRKKV